MKKYKLTDETKQLGKTVLHRIEALKDFGGVKRGDKGGWIEKEENLSQEDNCWVFGDAVVSDDARVYDNAWVYGNARVSNDTKVYGDAEVSGDARVFGNAWVFGNAGVDGNAKVFGNAWVYGNARVYGDAVVYGDAGVYGASEVYGNVKLSTGWCFAYKGENWNVTEIPLGDGGIVLVKDWEEPEDDDATEEAIELLKSKGYRIIKD